MLSLQVYQSPTIRGIQHLIKLKASLCIDLFEVHIKDSDSKRLHEKDDSILNAH